MDFHVTLLFDYDSSVRGGMSEAFLAYDREPISNFVVECADVVLRLADRGPTHLSTDYLIADIGLTKPGESGEEIPFLQLGVEKFGRDLFGNMIALGRLLCVCNVDFTDQHLRDALPKKYIDDNIAAIKYGYGLDRSSIKAIVPEQAASRFAERYAERVLAGTAPAEAVEQAAARS
jgi:Pyruvate/2-oxoacid:ferredoxin oxidoreductase gamma subunit